MRLTFDDKESFKEAAEGLYSSIPPNASDPNTNTSPLRRVESSSSSMPPRPEETRRSEESDCFNNPQSDPNTTLSSWRVGSSSSSSSSMLPQERNSE